MPNVESPYDPALPTPRRNETRLWEISAGKFPTALFITAPNQEGAKRPSAGRTGYHPAIRREGG